MLAAGTYTTLKGRSPLPATQAVAHLVKQNLQNINVTAKTQISLSQADCELKSKPALEELQSHLLMPPTCTHSLPRGSTF